MCNYFAGFANLLLGGEIMNQEKIGKFIAQCRKNKKLTQEQIAIRLGVSDRAVSKWERGLNLPDASLMLELAKILDISVNELLTGEIIKEKEYMNKAEENLVELEQIIENNNKRLLDLEVVLLIISILAFVIMIMTSEVVDDKFFKVILIGGASIILLTAIIFAFIIEKEAGYYECSKCHHKYVATYKQILISMHMGWTRKLKCPKCGEKSWSKKVLKK